MASKAMHHELFPSASSAASQASVSASSNPYCNLRDGGEKVTTPPPPPEGFSV